MSTRFSALINALTNAVESECGTSGGEGSTGKHQRQDESTGFVPCKRVRRSDSVILEETSRNKLPATPSQASLLGIPTELRRQIYRYVAADIEPRRVYGCSASHPCGRVAPFELQHIERWEDPKHRPKRLLHNAFAVSGLNQQVHREIKDDTLLEQNLVDAAFAFQVQSGHVRGAVVTPGLPPSLRKFPQDKVRCIRLTVAPSRDGSEVRDAYRTLQRVSQLVPQWRGTYPNLKSVELDLDIRHVHGNSGAQISKRWYESIGCLDLATDKSVSVLFGLHTRLQLQTTAGQIPWYHRVPRQLQVRLIRPGTVETVTCEYGCRKEKKGGKAQWTFDEAQAEKTNKLFNDKLHQSTP